MIEHLNLDFFLICSNWSRGYKTLFMLNSVEQEILNAHIECIKIQEMQLF